MAEPLNETYKRKLNEALDNNLISDKNKDLYKEFFEWEERKLKRINNFKELDNGNYGTLIGFLKRFANIERWFDYKPWIELTKEDIEQVYNDLEDGKITKKNGGKYEDTGSYYNKVFKAKPFKLAGKDEIAREVTENTRKKEEEVRFIRKEEFLKLLDVTKNIKYKCLLWLAFDIGENINALLKIQKKDCHRSVNDDTKEIEYKIHLPKEKIKRSRKERTEITNFKETSGYLDMQTRDLGEDDYLFNFQYGAAKKFLQRAVRETGVKCEPKGQSVTWKDLRSSMACYLLNEEWTGDEVKARLGHRPSSTAIDRYANYLAIGRHKPKKKLHDNTIDNLSDQLEKTKQREKLANQRMEDMKNQLNELQGMYRETAIHFQALRSHLPKEVRVQGEKVTATHSKKGTKIGV